MQKYIYGDVLLYATNHTIKEIQVFFSFPSYEATKRYLLLHNIKHLVESRAGSNNGHYKHGGKHTRLYEIWCGMKQRCYNKNSSHYPRWGGRGITVCSEWLVDFNNFKHWAERNGYASDLTIDRIDNNGNYCPENCRWASVQEQNNNQRTNRLVTFQGKTQNLKQWSKELGINYGTLLSRLDKSHWSIEKAFTAKVSRTLGKHKGGLRVD
jgi:hypothetical protein